MKAAEYNLIVAERMYEKDLQERVRRLARHYGVRYYHTHTAKFSPAGFPDVVMVAPPRVMFRELKRQHEKPTAAQREWLDDLAASGCDVGVWRPLDLIECRIDAELADLAKAAAV